MKKILFSLLVGIHFLQAQNRVITTGVPFLQIAADARAAGMADMGVATEADAFSQQYNPAKYAFALNQQSFATSYTPYLTSITNDIFLGQLNYYNRYNERSAFAVGFRYFGLGEIKLTDSQANELNSVNPNELALDATYALKLSEKFSMAVSGRYIRSNLKIADGSTDATAANSFAVDISGYFQSEEKFYTDFSGRWRGGFALQNLGPKIKYDANDPRSSNFLPTNLKLGGGFDFIFDEYNKVTALVEFNKLLVPTPQVPLDTNNNGFIDNGESQAAADAYKRTDWLPGVFKSFGDAPDGIKEELQEVTWALGTEYWYQDSFALRLGYFNENNQKGARKFATLGAGFKYNTVKIDVSYLFSTSSIRNPLENTLRFSLSFNFGNTYTNY